MVEMHQDIHPNHLSHSPHDVKKKLPVHMTIGLLDIKFTYDTPSSLLDTGVLCLISRQAHQGSRQHLTIAYKSILVT